MIGLEMIGLEMIVNQEYTNYVSKLGNEAINSYKKR